MLGGVKVARVRTSNGRHCVLFTMKRPSFTVIAHEQWPVAVYMGRIYLPDAGVQS